MADSRPLQPAWRRRAKANGAGLVGQVAVGVAALAAVLVLLHQTVQETVATWQESNAFNHGFLIVPICLYLAWTRRGALAAVTPKPDFRGVIPVLLAALVWLTGHATGTHVVQELSLVAILQAVVLTIYGWPVFRALLFPLLYLYLAVPMGEALIPPLEHVTAYFSVGLLRLAGIPVFWDGNLIAVPNGNFYVAEACAGLRYLISSVALGVLFAGLMFRTWWRRALFLLISLVVPVIANGIRAFGIIVIAYLTDNQVAVGVDHIVYGWLFFTLVSFLVLAFGMAIRERFSAPDVRALAATADRGSPAALIAAGILVLLPVAGAKAYGDHLDRPPAYREIHLALPEMVGSYRLLPGVRDPQQPALAEPDAEADDAYGEDGGQAIYLHIGFYLRERRGAEAAGSAHKLAGKDWLVTAPDSTTAMIGGEESLVQVQQTAAGPRRRLIWYWYWIDGRFTGNPYLAKLLQAKVKLLGGSQASAVIVAAVNYDARAAPAERSLRDFTAGLDGLASALAAASAD